MKLIAISHPEFILNEAERINALFRDGLLRLHLRKPGGDIADLNRLLGKIDPEFYPKIALHQHHELAAQYDLMRLHFPEKLRNDTPETMFQKLKNAGFQLSTSIHDIEQLSELSSAFDYTFFGPVFDSISKKGYQRIVNDDFSLKEDQKTIKVIAIGGINHSNIHKIKQMNFDGAAVLGAIWNSEASDFQFLKIHKLQFISNQTAGLSHLESIKLALTAGCRWIQLRVKNQPENEVLEIAIAAKELCDSYAARLIINDFPHVAKAVNAYGLHLGLNDMPIAEARKIVGHNMIIGGTANTFEDVLLRINEGADYIGLGPFRFTTTKQNLSPILGLDGYRVIMQKLSEHKLSIPIIAIGGILPDDIAEILATGIYGVAMSSALIQSKETKETVQKLEEILC
ncbi:thiamine phosphate synthase [Dyadobacter sp. CY107]|uniref:thiamine phosphate synthase n=1 Tax=Dyadobacter fanqingshengii TaxID=2906443 RepID=UPI001F3234BE|nr:thiamine phosphate synthase [Dyadobacter fanqingshengii]MCF2502279.1 thiamine phosphate synthase [Dyadobacter fanqingshengii]